MFKTSLRGVVAAAALALTGVAAQAATYNLDFDSVASGTSANSYLASQGINSFAFVDTATVDDDPVYDAQGFQLNEGAFHWVAGSNTVMVKSVSDFWTGQDLSVSKSNLLWNDNAPIMLKFATPTTVSAFSIQQDLSSYGFYTARLSFLDATGHVISGASVDFDQTVPGTTISSGQVAGVSAILLPAGKHYDNLSLSTVAAVPEPGTWALSLAGLALVGVIGQRRRRA